MSNRTAAGWPGRRAYRPPMWKWASNHAAVALSAFIQEAWRRKSWISSGMTISSKGTPCFLRRWARSTVWEKLTLRSSSPWMSRTGERQVSTQATGDDFQAMSARCWSSAAETS